MAGNCWLGDHGGTLLGWLATWLRTVITQPTDRLRINLPTPAMFERPNMPAFIPAKSELTICFAHVAYQLSARFTARQTGVSHFQVWTLEELTTRLPEADVLVISGLWRNFLLDDAPRLRFIQSIGAGVDQFLQEELRRRGIRLASARGVNRNAVAEHAMAHILAFTRHIHTGRDRQQRHEWRGMLGDLRQREDELGGKTMLIVGLGGIGNRLAHLAKAFDMRVLAIKRDPASGGAGADALYSPGRLLEVLPQADFVVLTCPLTAETENLINERALAAMQPTAYLINMARGRVVDEPALVASLGRGGIAGAGLDIFWDEPLPKDSPLWDFENVLITPHTAGETRRYEENVIDILWENLERLWREESTLRNEVV
jgi:D-2-hydroxyacid dehydrogenase (NADP+)